MARESLRIRILVDNTARSHGHLAQHGFSALCEFDGTTVLFDTGATGEVLVRNAAAMGRDLSTVRHVALSHGHWDHGGGLLDAMDAAPGARVWIPTGALLPRWSVGSGAERDIALPHTVRERLVSSRGCWIDVPGPVRIADGIRLTGPVPGARPSWTHEGLVRNPVLGIPDDVPEEQALVWETGRGLVVVVGCAHYGVPNLLAHLDLMLPGSRLRALVGGLHLEAASDVELDAVARTLVASDVELVVPCHCSGPAAAARLAARGVPCDVGRVGWSGVFTD